MSEPESEPEFIAPIVSIKDFFNVRQIIVRCPFCKKHHSHGGGSIDHEIKDYIGPRVAHCGKGSYEIREIRKAYRSKNNET